MREARWRDVRGLHVGGKYWRRGWTDRWFRDGNRRVALRDALGPEMMSAAVLTRDALDGRVSSLTRRLDANIVLLELSSGGEDTKRVHDLAGLVNDHVNYLAWLRRQDDDALEIAVAERLVLHDLMALSRLVRWLLGVGGQPRDV